MNQFEEGKRNYSHFYNHYPISWWVRMRRQYIPKQAVRFENK